MTAAPQPADPDARRAMQTVSAQQVMHSAFSRAVAPRRPGLVSEWAERHRVLSSKSSDEPGPWRNRRNPPLVEVMDCGSARSAVTNVVALFPIQIGKSEVEMNILGYTICENPMPIMVVLPGEVSMNKIIDQKISPMFDSTPALQNALVSLNSRETSNRRAFKDFEGGQLYIEHAGDPKRLKSTSAGLVLCDEFSSFASSLKSGDDPEKLVDGRTTAFTRAKRFKVGTPEVAGACRLTELWEKSDQREYNVPCPDCGHMQPFVWSGLMWTPGGHDVWYVCRDCGSMIREHQKTAMIESGRWIPRNPGATLRGYHLNALYYPVGLGLTWPQLVAEFLEAQGDPAKLKTFVNDRLAEAWVDESTRNVRTDLLRDRAEPYRLRTAPLGVLCVTAGVDTQDNRLAVQIIGWGRNLRAWTLDYVELPGDPANPEVWDALTDLINSPILHISGALLRVEATAIDAGGHRTEDVKHYVRQRRIRRPMAIFGARQANAPVLSKAKLADITWQGKTDKAGVHIYQVGGIDITHRLYARIGQDADKVVEDRLVHLSDELPDEFFGGLLSEVWDPRKGRYVPRRGAPRNEPLDTWKYAYAATHHQELRLHRATIAKWDALELQLAQNAAAHRGSTGLAQPQPTRRDAPTPAPSGEGAPLPPPRETLRGIAFAIERLATREPETLITAELIERWRHVEHSSPDEARLHAELIMAVNAPGQAIGACLPRDLLARVRSFLAGLPAANLAGLTRRPASRRVRSRGVG